MTPDLNDIATVMDIVVPAANEGEYELDGWTLSEKKSIRKLTLTLVRDLSVNGHEEPVRPAEGTIEAIHRSAEADAED